MLSPTARFGSVVLILVALVPKSITAFTRQISKSILPCRYHASTTTVTSSQPSTVTPSRLQRQFAIMVQSSDTEVKGPGRQQAEGLKKTILGQSKGTSNGLKATPEQRDNIATAVNALVALNPTKSISRSERATGLWNLVYTTTPGASGGKLGPFIGEVQQEVDIAKGLYVNYVRLGPLTGELIATWEVANEQQWKVIFQTIAFSLWGNQLMKKELGQAGLWTLSYLDDDMRILTARSLERCSGNLYVLARA